MTNVNQIVKLVRETYKNTKLYFSLIICRTDIKDIDGNIKEVNSHIENYCKQQNLGFINNDNISKYDLAAKELHLKDRESSRLEKNLLEYNYWISVKGNSIPNKIKQNSVSLIEALQVNNISHPKCVSLGYLNINSIRNKISSIPFLIENNLDVFATAETKLDSSFPGSQFLPE